MERSLSSPQQAACVPQPTVSSAPATQAGAPHTCHPEGQVTPVDRVNEGRRVPTCAWHSYGLSNLGSQSQRTTLIFSESEAGPWARADALPGPGREASVSSTQAHCMILKTHRESEQMLPPQKLSTEPPEVTGLRGRGAGPLVVAFPVDRCVRPRWPIPSVPADRAPLPLQNISYPDVPRPTGYKCCPL